MTTLQTDGGRVEGEICQLKRGLQVTLKASGAPIRLWPTAIRHVALERMQDQLKNLGITPTPMLPYYAQVTVKTKRWHKSGGLAAPSKEVRLLGPQPNYDVGVGGSDTDMRGRRSSQNRSLIGPCTSSPLTRTLVNHGGAKHRARGSSQPQMQMAVTGEENRWIGDINLEVVVAAGLECGATPLYIYMRKEVRHKLSSWTTSKELSVAGGGRA